MSSSPEDGNGHDSVPVRVALVGCTGILGDIISKAVGENPAIDVVARLESDSLVNTPAHTVEADLVLWNNADESEVSRWLNDVKAAPRVLATLGDGRSASLWQLTPQRTELGALSPAVLVETIRTGVPQSSPGETPDPQDKPWPSN